ncbi:hypothetical protein ACF0H5_005461 [Mactra antiquata]
MLLKKISLRVIGQARLLPILRANSTALEAEAPKLSRRQRIVNYFKNILNDYKDVAIETGQDMKKHPLKSSIYISLITSTLVLMKTRPSEQNLHDRLTECTTDIMLVGERIRNPKSETAIDEYSRYANEGRLRCYNLGVCTLVCLKSHSKDVKLYSANCKYTEPHWTEFFSTVYDVGVFGKWRNLEKAMIDFDINTEEWDDDGQPNKKFKYYSDNLVSWDMKMK